MSDPRAPALLVLVPVFNEAPRLAASLGEIAAALGRLSLRSRLVVLDDGSTDLNDEVERAALAAGADEIRRAPINEGKGAVLARALPGIDEEIVVVIDGDGEYPAAAIADLLGPIERGEADVVLGSRYGFGRPRPPQYLAAWLVNRAVNRLFGILSGVRLNDLLSGLFAVRRDVVAGIVLREKRFAYTGEFVWALHRRGARFVEVPIDYRFRRYAEGKKIRWWEAATILFALLRYARGAGGR